MNQHVQDHASSSDDPIVEVEGISKSFGPVQALEDISLSVEQGEVLTVAGDNGAGKSTLIKILSGVLQQSSGTVRIDKKSAKFESYSDAQSAGIETVYQDLAVAANRTVYENIFLGKELLREGPLGEYLRLVDDQRMRKKASAVLDSLGMDLNSDARVGNLSGGEQQSVAVARAVQSDPSIIIMDEPTSALSVESAEQILHLIKRLRSEGITIILIDHNLEEIFEVSDRVAVLASGRLVGVRDAESLTKEKLVEMMMGVSE